jgi:uncharacterized membrane-anchored protein
MIVYLLAALAASNAIATAGPTPPAADPALEAERKRLEAVVRELDKEGRVEAAFASAREVMQEGPARIKLSDQAVLMLPKGDVFVPAAEAAGILRAWDARPGPDLLGMVLPASGTRGQWFVVLHFNGVGHVRDDDAKRWSAEALLAALKEGATAAGANRGAGSVSVLGWLEPPRYDPAARQLVWSLATTRSARKASTANYNTFMLGREGYISMNLVADADEIERNKPVMKALLAGLAFREGKRYDEFDASTDRLAPHGLTALVAGPAPAKPPSASAPPARVDAPPSIQGWHIGAALAACMVILATWRLRRSRASAPESLPAQAAPMAEPGEPVPAAVIEAQGSVPVIEEASGPPRKLRRIG